MGRGTTKKGHTRGVPTGEPLTKTLILPDSHTPYHDRRALEDLIIHTLLPTLSPYRIVILGDWFDCYALSTFPKNPSRERNLEKELEVGFRILSHFSSIPEKVFIEGNHERRLKRYLAEKAPELYDIVLKWFRSHFEEWVYVPYMEDIPIGKIFYTHDVGRSGENSTKLSVHDYQDNVVIGHNHLFDYLIRANARGVAHVGASFGWLGDVSKIDYRHRMKSRRDWVLGYGVAYSTPSGVTFISPKPIVNYQTEIEGRLYRV